MPTYPTDWTPVTTNATAYTDTTTYSTPWGSDDPVIANRILENSTTRILENSTTRTLE